MLNITWFILWGLLWALYFMLDGFDLGLGALMPLYAKNDTEKRMILNAMGPFWDGNEVWLITAGGATFAAFPKTYAVMFSTLYAPLLLILFALILRGVAFEFRSKVESHSWRQIWEWCLIIGSFAPALLFGVAFANIFKGIPFDAQGMFHGDIFTLLNPYGLAGGLFFLFFFFMHGAIWASVKTKGMTAERAKGIAPKLWIITLILAVLFLTYSGFATTLYNNYLSHPVLFVIPLIAVVALLMVRVFMAKNNWWKAWFASAVTIVMVTYFGITGMFPNLYPSSLDPAASLNIYNSASTQGTLKIMFVVVLICVPFVLAYQIWHYIALRHPVTEEIIHDEDAY
ncbi:MAG: cytochrome d ubiquinol oxidase subunit II [Acidobacteria bacterium CG_4_9_14_3_um_filter_49_7]|nr:MAG: cytochrome d ubiquinol oxidase subunit II [Acidobacteria bacterium CG_4_9_14_3_um_filter_49_7]